MSYGDDPDTIRARTDRQRTIVHLVAKISTLVVVGTIGIVLMFQFVTPKFNLYKANTEKQAVIADQRAQSEAAEYAFKR